MKSTQRVCSITLRLSTNECQEPTRQQSYESLERPRYLCNGQLTKQTLSDVNYG